MAPPSLNLNLVARDIAWTQVSGGGAWAFNCDWAGGSADIGNARIPGEQCGDKCATTKDCTHFTWTNTNGGTCWLKSGAVTASQAFGKTNDQAVCGYIKSTAATAPVGIKWNYAADGSYWSPSCDWNGQDFAKSSVRGSQCSQECIKTAGCTHYTWTNLNGGTCWMKNGNVTPSAAFATTKDGAVCGAVSGTPAKSTTGQPKTTTAKPPQTTNNQPPKTTSQPPKTTNQLPQTTNKPTTTKAAPVTTQPSSPGKTITSAWAAAPASATRFPYIECDKTNTCYQRNTFLIPAWQNIASTIQESGDMSFGLGRFYLVDPAGSTYKQFYLNNRQITFNVDVAGVKCGQNSALYFSAMPVGLGSQYCDGQGSCMEMDIFEGNVAATQFTTHECKSRGQVNGNQCNHNGCSDTSNTKYSSQVGPKSFIDTTRPFKITTKFITSDNTDSGTLSSIVQVFEQDGKTFQTGNVNTGTCTAEWGGVPQMGKGMADGMTLILSFWEGGMDWLDGGFGNPKCASAVGQSQPAKYSKIRVEPIA
ncbi:hypothetical protein CcCBS67573_g09115 [Chytriomyces confervae]|uniref:Glucanase n=1 Tax=Chytriomyces confervae TaxID=246404 RepID=A0A507E7E4_9FUNG|nr:hypothetical protein CcCBS67573_g09115 [Chytriomyces confervae]